MLNSEENGLKVRSYTKYFRSVRSNIKQHRNELLNKTGSYRVSRETWQFVNNIECRLSYTVLDILRHFVGHPVHELELPQHQFTVPATWAWKSTFKPFWDNFFNTVSGADTGGAGDISPPEFGIFCSHFQNSFSIACLRERNPIAKQEKYLS